MQLSAKVMTLRKRAGFWRRALSLGVDSVIVFLPIQIIAAALFAITAGSVQFTGGAINMETCEPVSQLPQNLSPAPPANPTKIEDCHVSLFGAETSRRLVVVRRVTDDGKTKETVSRQYTLDKNGNPIHAFSLDWIAYIALVAYLIWGKEKTGATPGDHASRITTIGITSNDDSPPPLKNLLIRYLVLAGPYVFVQILNEFNFSNAIGTTADTVMSSLIAVLCIGFYLICLVQIVMRRDPLYDRVAGTAVVERTA